MWWANVIGYSYSLVLGHIFVKLNSDALWAGQGVEKEHLELWHPALLGMLERVLYTASFQIGKPEFIAVWLAMKAVPQWKRWSEITELGGKTLEGRAVYNIFLIGSGLSVLYAVTGAKLIEWIDSEHAVRATLVGLGVVIGTLWSFLETNRRACKALKRTLAQNG